MARKYLADKSMTDLDLFSMVILVKGPKGELGGYNPIFFVQKVSERCMCCYSIPRSPFQASCGHRACRSCLYDIIFTSENPACFVCNVPLDKKDCYPDHALLRQLNMLQIRCPFTSTCDWVDQVDQLGVHFRECVGVSGLFRSWMQSIQAFLGNLQNRSISLNRRVDELEGAIRSHQELCQQRYVEQDGRSKYFTQQLRYMREQCNLQPRNAERDPLVEESILQGRTFLELLAALTLDLHEEAGNNPQPQNPDPPYPAPPNPNPPINPLTPVAPQEEWTCSYCTVVNPMIVNICQTCYKTRVQPESNPDIARVCMGCLAHNPAEAIVCQNCQRQI